MAIDLNVANAVEDYWTEYLKDLEDKGVEFFLYRSKLSLENLKYLCRKTGAKYKNGHVINKEKFTGEFAEHHPVEKYNDPNYYYNFIFNELRGDWRVYSGDTDIIYSRDRRVCNLRKLMCPSIKGNTFRVKKKPFNIKIMIKNTVW